MTSRSNFIPLPLPARGEPYLISEMLSSSTEVHKLHGKTVRVVGRVKRYDPKYQLVLLTEPPSSASSSSSNSKASLPPNSKTGSSTAKRIACLLVDTRLTEVLDCRCGSQVMFIGEIEAWPASRLAEISREEVRNQFDEHGGIGTVHQRKDSGDSFDCEIVLKAVISKCVDRLDYGMYLRCIPILRGMV